MKKIICVLLTFISLNSFANSVLEISLMPSETLALSSLSISGNTPKEAAQVINDSQAYIQSGELTVFLAQKIKDMQALDSSLTDEDAFDALVSVSIKILK